MGKLGYPSDKWVSYATPETHRGNLVSLFQEGHIWRDERTNLWYYKGSGYFVIVDYIDSED